MIEKGVYIIAMADPGHCIREVLRIFLQKKDMKKVLVIFDGAHFPSSTLDFALEMNRNEPILLTGIFLPSVDYAEAMRYLYYGNALVPLYLEEYEDDAVSIKKNMEHFEAFCKQHHIRYRIHGNIRKGIVKELQHQTRYADVMVISSMHFYENLGEMMQEDYLDGTLHKTECPIILLPGAYSKPDNIVFAYDGSASSMHALRQFIYLFPQWTDLNTLIIYAGDGSDDIPFLALIKEYASQHFSKLGYYKLNADPKKYFATWIEEKGAALLVSGSYGRSAFSELFRRNFLKEIVKEQSAPIFIAHL
jgi:hypothetical protein